MCVFHVCVIVDMSWFSPSIDPEDQTQIQDLVANTLAH